MVCNNQSNQVCKSSLVFKGVNNISEDLLLNILEANFKTFFDWSFLNLGSWFDAEINQYGIYSSDQTHSMLVPVNDEAYANGQVWQTPRKDWVWETGCFMDNANPIEISGIYVNSTFHPYASGTFVRDYVNGRIIFDEAISVASVVKMNYSYKNVQVYRASDQPWFSEIQYGSFNTSDLDLQKTDDGSWSISGNHRIQLPAIVIDPIPRSQSFPYEIGSTSLTINQDIGFYVLAENKNDRNKLLDIIRLQQDLTMMLYDTNKLAKDDKYPLDYNGDLKINPIMYPEIVENYFWKKCYIKNVNLFEMTSLNPNFHQGMARATVEIISS